MKLYIDKKIRIGFAFSVVVLIILGVNSFFYVRRVIFSSESAMHFQQAMMILEKVKSANARTDVSQLAFAISGASEDSISNTQAITDLRDQIHEMEYLIIADTVQRKKIAELREIVLQKTNQPNAQIRAGLGNSTATKLPSKPLSRELNQRIDQLIHEIEKNETLKKRERQIEVTSQFYQFVYTSLGLLFISVLLPFIMAYLLNKSLMSRTRAEEKLRSALVEIHDLYENAPCGYFSVNKDGMITNMNKTTLRWLGYQREELIDRRHYSDILKSSSEENNYDRVRNEGVVVDMESFMIRKNKSVFPVVINASVVKDKNDNYVSSRWTLFDNTARKKAENETLRANGDLEAFSYSVSHDLRAPLRSINGYSQILKDENGDKLGEEGNRTLDVIIKNAIRMGRLIDDLLNFSKLGRKEIVKSRTDMSELVKSLLDDLMHLEKDRKIELAIKPLHNSIVDPNMIRHVWENLLSNALKYTNKKDVAVIEITSEEQPTEIIYSVKDNGAGFDMKYIDKLFSVFQRLHKQNEFDGTGVGLALAKRIIEKHHGRIWVTAEPGKGASFYFSIPT